jgi:hypothetical protein
MNFSDKTIAILKNFATINPSILFKSGNILRTMSAQKTIMAIANIDETIPKDAGVYELNRFISSLELYKNPSIEFGDKYFTISEGKSKTRYVYTNESMIITPPEKEIKIPKADVELDITWDDIQSVIKASKIFQLPEISFVGDGEKCYIKAINSDDPTTDTFGVELCDTEDEFNLIIKVENIKLMPGDYHVSLSSKGISMFEAECMKYFIAVDSKSNYKKG